MKEDPAYPDCTGGTRAWDVVRSRAHVEHKRSPGFHTWVGMIAAGISCLGHWKSHVSYSLSV